MAVTAVGQPVAAIKVTTSSGSFSSFTPNAASGYVISAQAGTDGSGTQASITGIAWATGGSWTRIGLFQPGVFLPEVSIWYCKPANQGTGAITVTGNAHVNAITAEIEEVTGEDQTTPAGASATSSSAVNNLSIASPQTTGGLIFLSAEDTFEGFTPTANSTSTLLDFHNISGQVRYGLIGNANTVAGTSYNVGVTNTVTNNNQLALELRAAPVTGPYALQAAGQFPPFNAPFIEPNAVPFQLQGDRAGITQITLTDTGTADDSSFTVSAAVPLADTGAGADSIAVTAAVPLSDTGTADDSSFTVAAAVPLSDTGTASDAISVNIVDYGYVASPLPFPPFSPPFIEPNIVPLQLQGDRSAIPQISLSDTAAADDSSFTVTAAVPLSDTGTGSDAVTIAAAVPLADTGTGTDAVTVTAAVSLSDTGTASDSISILITGGDSPTYPNAAPLWPPIMFVIQPPVFQFAGGLGVVPVTTVPPYTVTASDTAAVGVTSTSSPAASVTGASSAAVNVTSTTTP